MIMMAGHQWQTSYHEIQPKEVSLEVFKNLLLLFPNPVISI
tara:strand:- start:443 stop:565 length:123 start_codon:yes stop_codon:yes gene_type:complete